MNQDLEHLRLLSIFHYIVAALTFLFACLPLIHLFFGIAMITGWEGFEGDKPPAFVGWFLTCFAGVFILAGWTLAICIAQAGRYLMQRTHYTFCLVIAAIACILMPLGTALGIFTIIVLMRPSVREMFEGGPVAAPAV